MSRVRACVQPRDGRGLELALDVPPVEVDHEERALVHDEPLLTLEHA